MKHIKNYSSVQSSMKAYYAHYAQLKDEFVLGEQHAWQKRLEAADKAGRVLEISIRVTWHRSRGGEFNPHAEAWLFFEDPVYGSRSAYGEGRADGGGYDKRSAAVSEALEFNVKRSDTAERKEAKRMAQAALDRFVIEHGETLWKEYCVSCKPMPHLCFGGKGMGTFTRLFRRMGCKPYGPLVCSKYVIDYCETDGKDDTYHIIRKDRV